MSAAALPEITPQPTPQHVPPPPLSGWEKQKDAAAYILELALPCALTFTLSTLLAFVNLIFVGQFGARAIAAVALGMMWANMSGLAVGFGVGGALDVLCSQAYGAKNYPLLGVYLQRACLIVSLLCIPMATAWWYTDRVLALFIADADLIQLAASFVRHLIPGLWPLMIVVCCSRFLQTQRLVHAPLLISIGACFTHVVTNVLFLDVFKFGFLSPAAATCATLWFTLFLYAVYMRTSLDVWRKTWHGWTRDCFRGWGQYLWFAVPGMFMMCAEAWALEVTTAFAAQLSTADLDAHGIMVNTCQLWLIIPLGISIATATKLGGDLGSGKPESARANAVVGLWIAFIYSSANSILYTVVLRDSWGHIYSQGTDVVDLIGELVPVVGLFSVFDAVNCTMAGVLRGQGRMWLGACGNVLAYYVCGLPCGYLLAFQRGYGLYGLWLGLCLGQLVAALFFSVFVFRTNWNELADRAGDRSIQPVVMKDEHGTELPMFASVSTQERSDDSTSEITIEELRQQIAALDDPEDEEEDEPTYIRNLETAGGTGSSVANQLRNESTHFEDLLKSIQRIESYPTRDREAP